MVSLNISIDEFLETGFCLKEHLTEYLQLSTDELDRHLKQGLENMASLHPGGFNSKEINDFYESQVGEAHLFDLANWHLQSSNYIADTLRLQQMFAKGNVLDFGGGIGTHAIAATALPEVKHVFFVELNPRNRQFLEHRVEQLGIGDLISIHRDFDDIPNIKFDTITCLDVLEHLSNPASQLLDFHKRLSPSSIALMNWYFFKGDKGEYPFHIDDKVLIEQFFLTLQTKFIEVFHPFLITARAYKPILE